MTEIYVDATPLIALGSVSELDLLTNFDGDLFVPRPIVREVTTEPAATNLDRFLEAGHTTSPTVPDDELETARELLGESEPNGDAHLVGAVLARDDVGVVSDDRRVRTTARSLGARVTGTVGVVVRAVEEGLDATEAKALVRRIDSRGLHMTGELREKAYDLIESAAET